MPYFLSLLRNRTRKTGGFLFYWQIASKSQSIWLLVKLPPFFLLSISHGSLADPPLPRAVRDILDLIVIKRFKKILTGIVFKLTSPSALLRASSFFFAFSPSIRACGEESTVTMIVFVQMIIVVIVIIVVKMIFVVKMTFVVNITWICARLSLVRGWKMGFSSSLDPDPVSEHILWVKIFIMVMRLWRSMMMTMVMTKMMMVMMITIVMTMMVTLTNQPKLQAGPADGKCGANRLVRQAEKT